MPVNEGTIDRTLRVVLGLALLSLAFVGPRTPWGYLGLVPLLTGALGSCPIYAVLGFSTCPQNSKSAERRPSYKGRPVDVVIDVRSKLEYWLGHLDGATCIPLSDIVVRIARRPDVNPDSRIMVYCASGARSATATTQLRAMGYRNVTDAGGMSQALLEYEP